MADLRFKISGTSTPFVARIYTTGASPVLSGYQVVERSAIPTPLENHTCVIFSGLPPATSYNIDISDSVGTTCRTTTPITTSENPTGFIVTRNIRLLGTSVILPVTLKTAQWSPQTVADGCGGKCLRIDPPLATGECIRVCLCAWTDLESGSDCSTVNVFKRTSPSASYSLVKGVDDDTCKFTVDIGAGETVCYDGFTLVNTHTSGGPYYACNSLSIICAASSVGTSPIDCITCGPETCLTSSLTCTVPVTTTTTSNTPYKVYFSRPLYGTVTCKPSATAKLYTDPQLPVGGTQSFRVHFYLKTHYEYDAMTINAEMRQTAKICKSASDYDQVITNSALCTSIAATATCSFSRVVTQDTMGDLTFTVCSNDCTDNIGIPHQTYACMCICKIDQQVGGTFSYGGVLPPGTSQGIEVSTLDTSDLVPLDTVDKTLRFDTLVDDTDGNETTLDRDSLTQL